MAPVGPESVLPPKFDILSLLAVNAGSNKASTSTGTGKSAAKLEAETEDFHREWRLEGISLRWAKGCR